MMSRTAVTVCRTAAAAVGGLLILLPTLLAAGTAGADMGVPAHDVPSASAQPLAGPPPEHPRTSPAAVTGSAITRSDLTTASPTLSYISDGTDATLLLAGATLLAMAFAPHGATWRGRSWKSARRTRTAGPARRIRSAAPARRTRSATPAHRARSAAPARRIRHGSAQ